VELLPEVVAVLPEFAPENAALAQPSVFRLFIADARRFVRCAPDAYDVIVADLFHPAEDGAGFLYTQEHFAALRARLAPGGLACQWLPLHQLDLDIFRDITATFLSVFPDATLWLLRFNVDVPVVGLVGGRDGVLSSYDILRQRLEERSLSSALGPVALNSAARILGCCLAGPRNLRELARGGVIATDDLPRVLFRAPAVAYARKSEAARHFEELLSAADPEFSSWMTMTTAGEALSVLNAFRHARDLHLRGLLRERMSQVDLAIEDYLKSAAASAEYTAGYAQAVLVASAYARQDPGRAREILRRLVEIRPQERLAAEVLERIK
jgi:spermidine synthase